MNKPIRLFLETLKLSACTFGGGFVIVPLMRRKFVEELKWIDEQEMLDLTAIAQSSPGPIAVNAAMLVGYRTLGARGALIAALGTLLPPLVIISIISLFYAAFRDNIYVNRAMTGMLAGVAAVIADVVLRLGKDVLGKRTAFSLTIMLLAFAATYVLKVNILFIMLACGLIGAIDTLLAHRREVRK